MYINIKKLEEMYVVVSVRIFFYYIEYIIDYLYNSIIKYMYNVLYCFFCIIYIGFYRYCNFIRNGYG